MAKFIPTPTFNMNAEDKVLEDMKLNFDNILNPDESDNQYNNFNSNKGLLKLAGLGVAGGAALKLGKRAVARGIDTYGFGANVTGSYQGDSKIAQYTNNLITAAKGKKYKVPFEAVKSIVASGNPVEINALNNSLEALENYMSKLKSAGKRIPKNVKNYYLDLQTMAPERKMAQAILQKSFNQKVNFPYGGKFVSNSNVQLDPDIGKALSNKGFNINKPFTRFDVSDDKFMIKKLRTAATGDPRIQLITKALKENRVKDAKRIAKKGQFKYGGKIIKSNRPIKLVKEGNGYVAKFVPQYAQKGGKLASVKEYVLGGHTQRIHFKPFKGHRGFHKAVTDVFDITSYASAGEKADNLITKGRILLAGEGGRKVGIHQPIVTTAVYKHRAPGGGRIAGITDTIKRKSRKFREAGTRTYKGNKVTKNVKKSNKALRLALLLASKGRIRL